MKGCIAEGGIFSSVLLFLDIMVLLALSGPKDNAILEIGYYSVEMI
jgi:hypothetical protein